MFRRNIFHFFFVALRPNAGHGLLILEVSRSHTTTHQSLWTSDQLVTENFTWQHTTLTTSMPPVGFQPTISTGERPQTYALDRATTETGNIFNSFSPKKKLRNHILEDFYIFIHRDPVFNNFTSLFYIQQTEMSLCQIRLPARIRISLSKLIEWFNRYLHYRRVYVKVLRW
jgi:hypothetical protein